MIFSPIRRRAVVTICLAAGLVGTTAATARAQAGSGQVGAHAANANFVGTWAVHYVDANDTIHVVVDREDGATGTFSGTVDVPGSGDFAGDFDIENGVVSGNHFSFSAETYDIDDQDNTYTADFSGTISDNSFSGDLEGDIEPPPTDDAGDPVDYPLADGGPIVGRRATVPVSGTIEVECGADATSCSAPPGPLLGVDVAIDNSDGDRVAGATTDVDGKWSADVAPGADYVITPSAPDVTFTPEHLTIDDLEAATSGEDFTAPACGADSADLTGAIHRSAAGSIWVLHAGTRTCPSEFEITYLPKPKFARGSAFVTWRVNKLVCGVPKYFPVKSHTQFNSELVAGARGRVSVESTGANAGTVTVQVDDVDAYGASVLVLVFTINPNGTSGTVTSHGSYYKATENVGDSSIACEVSSGTAALTPGSAP